MAVRPFVIAGLLVAGATVALSAQRGDVARPPVPRERFAVEYQGNFGGITVPGCRLYNDILFDPQLLPMWLQDRPCFDRSMAAHAARGDNRVVVSPAICYHGGEAGPCADIWHEPQRFREFLEAIRRHRNARGETIEPLVVWIQDEHFRSFLRSGREGTPDPQAEAHAVKDLEAMAAVTRDLISGHSLAWEPRPQREWMTAGTYERLATRMRQLWPDAWIGVHLTQDSSSWTSAEGGEGDDPNRGDRTLSWQRCRKAGWCDGLLFQAAAGDAFINPERHPNYTGRPGWAGRWLEIVQRLGAGSRGWPRVDLVFWEAVYDAYHGRVDEQVQIARCKEALSIAAEHGVRSSCGSASHRP
jgi:hypothetical protein